MSQKAHTKVVEIGRVITQDAPPVRGFVERMKRVLKRDGQIEPLQVRAICLNDNDMTDENSMFYLTFEQDAWAKEIVHAARALDWPTLLVCVTPKFIE
jgi:hypothetical protein